jgi:hypothetical protein
MSAQQTEAQPRHYALLAELALRQLLDRHSDKLTDADLTWLSGLRIQAAQGRLPSFNQVVRVSKIRAQIAKRRNEPDLKTDDEAADWNGAA